MFSLYVLLCQVVQGKCVILQDTDDMSGTYRRGGPGRFCVPTETLSGRGSEVFLHCLCGWWWSSFNHRIPVCVQTGAPLPIGIWGFPAVWMHTPNSDAPGVWKLLNTSGTDVPLKAFKDIGELCENTGGKFPKASRASTASGTCC